MADSVRMADLSPLSRGLEGLRRLDPEQRVHTDRAGTQTAAEHLTEVHKDVPNADEATETHDHDQAEQRKSRHRRDAKSGTAPAEAAAEAPPESSEGHLLDIQA